MSTKVKLKFDCAYDRTFKASSSTNAPSFLAYLTANVHLFNGYQQLSYDRKGILGMGYEINEVFNLISCEPSFLGMQPKMNPNSPFFIWPRTPTS